MAKFILCGTLGDHEFGNVLEIKVRNTREAITSMIHQIDGFRNKLRGINFRLRINGRSCIGNTESDVMRAMLWPLGENDVVVISPAHAGAGGSNIIGGVLMIVAGIVAVVLAVPTGGASLAAWSAGSMALAAAGALMVFGGAAMLFTKIPKAGKFDTQTNSEKNTSFSSLDNMAGQGRPVPILIGTMLSGSMVIQQSIDVLPR